jgi:hypothetical protein
MSRIWCWLAGTLLALALALCALLGGAPAAYAGPGDDPPEWCFAPNAEGELPTCTWDGQHWRRTYGSEPGSAAGAGGFAGLFVLAIIVGVGATVWKVTTARRMARDSGMNESDATTMTLLTDDGFEATYLAANLRGQTPPAVAPVTPSAVDRLEQLRALRDQGLITPDEYDVRRTAIIDSV